MTVQWNVKDAEIIHSPPPPPPQPSTGLHTNRAESSFTACSCFCCRPLDDEREKIAPNEAVIVRLCLVVSIVWNDDEEDVDVCSAICRT